MRLAFGGVIGWASHYVSRLVCGALATVVAVLASFLLVCAPAGAVVCGNEALRGESSSSLLPDCRAYEMVTPAYQEGFPLLSADYSPDGNDLIVEGLSNIAGAPGAGEEALEPALYSETRGVGGWQIASLNAPLSEFVGQVPIAREASSGLSLWMQHTPEQSAKTRDLYIRSASGVYSFVGPLDPHDTSSEEPSNSMEVQIHERGIPEAATSDYRHIVLKAYEASDYWSFDNTKGPNSVYEYSGTGNSHPILVAVNGPEKGGTNLIDECGAVLGGGERGSAYNALSADGETVFFTVEPCGTAPETAEVYARRYGSLVSPLPAETIDVSKSECKGVSCGVESGKNFEGASEDGKRVYFTSTQKLTNSSVDGTVTGNAAEGEGCAVAVTAGGGGGGCNLYEYEFLPEQKHVLRVVAGGDEVLGVVGVAEDGEHVYFIAQEEISGTGENEYHARPVREQPNLYVYDASTQETKFIVTLSPSTDQSDWTRFFQNRSTEVSGDTGQFLLFVSAKKNPGVTPDTVGGLPQLFEYDADTGELVRVSKGENGYDNNGNNATPGISFEHIAGIANKLQNFRTSSDKLNMSVDGKTVVFETAGGLSPLAFSAQKGCTSVYEFRTMGALSQGAVHLISDGRDVQANKGFACGAVFEGMDASGDNILFSTADPLVVGDIDGVVRSIYDARVEGGLSPQPAQGETGTCSASSCVGPVGGGPLPSVLGSLSEPAEGNTVPVVAPLSSGSGKSSAKKSSGGRNASRRKESAVFSHARRERASRVCVGERGRVRVLCLREAKRRDGVGRSLGEGDR